jgi:hypothetical protein
VKYGAESLTLRNEMESLKGVGKGSIGKNIGANIRKWLAEKKKNKEMYNKFKSPDIVTVIEVGRLE